MKHHLFGDSPVELIDGEELAVAQRSVYVVVGELDMVLNQGLVFRLARPGRYGHATEVFDEVLHRTVDLRLVPVSLYDGGFEVVCHDDLRNASDVSQAALYGIQEVVHLLGPNGHCKSVIGCGKRRHEDLALHVFPRIKVDEGHRVPGKVHEQVLSAFPVRRQHEGRFLGLRILVDMKAELRIPISVRLLRPVLAPEQIHRHVLPLQLRRNVWKTFLEVLEPVVAVCRIAAGQHPFDLRLFHRQQRREGDTAGLRQCDILVDRTLVQVQFPAY